MKPTPDLIEASNSRLELRELLCSSSHCKRTKSSIYLGRLKTRETEREEDDEQGNEEWDRSGRYLYMYDNVYVLRVVSKRKKDWRTCKQ